MEFSLKPRHVTTIRRTLDEFLADYGVPDELLVSRRQEREEFSRELFTLALSGQREMTLHFSQNHITSLQFPCQRRNGKPIEFVRIDCNDSQMGSRLAQVLNTIFTMSVNDHLPTAEKVVRTLLEKRLDTSFFRAFPIFEVPAPQFHAECYGGGGKNREITELFERLSQRGQVEHRRFKVVCQWGNTLRIDVIEIHLPKACTAFFTAVDGIINVWQY
jgi:hypothetical protein